MSNILPMLFGAFLVAIGVVASALADRIRGLRFRTHVPRFLPKDEADVAELAPAPRRPRGTPADGVPAQPAPRASKHRDQVVAALTSAGYGKAAAANAADACPGGDRGTAEKWASAALRKLARGEV